MGLSVSRAYDASHPIFRVLRAFGWGPLLNLGYYPFGRPLALLNFLVTPAALVPRFRLPMAQLRLVERAVALLQLAPGHRVLDVGCGRGASSFLIASEFPGVQVIGIDLLPEHITVARTLYGNTPHLTYEQGDAMKLDHLKPRTVDRALCLEAAFHFSDRARFLERLSVLLKPGGRAVIVDFMWQTDAAASACGGRATDYVRRIWRWEDFDSVAAYRGNVQRLGLLVDACHDWSSHVTAPLGTILDWVSWLASSPWGRWLLIQQNPVLRGLTDEDWEEFVRAAAAHRHVNRYTSYVALVVRRPPVPRRRPGARGITGRASGPTDDPPGPA